MLRTCRILLLAVSSYSLTFAQNEPNSITVSVSRTSTLQADQASFLVSVTTTPAVGLDDVVAALASLGITAGNFTGLNSSAGIVLLGTPSPQPSVLWGFSLAVPLSKLKDTFASLATLQASIGKTSGILSLSYNLTGTQISPQLAQSQTCSVAGLVSDATAQAQSIAVASGLTLGPIVAIASSTPTGSSLAGFVLANPFAATLAPTQSCGFTVKFSAIRF